MRTAARVIVLLPLAALMACSLRSAEPSSSSSGRAAGLPDPASLHTCEETFRVWVEGSGALNDPGAVFAEQIVGLESIQRRVFELCTLAEAERFNREILVEVAPGLTEPLIKPDFRTFAEVECVDESPLLDGTRLCAEVSN